MAGLNMQIEEVRIDEISNHPTNPKIHPDTQIKLLQKSIKRFGWTNPVILSADNTILAGHARVQAAIAAGNDTVPAIRTKLTGKEADAYLLADNRLSDIAPYDRDILAELLSDLPKDLAELTGFDSVQVEALLSGEEIPDIDRFISDSQPEEPREEVDAEPQIDRAAELNKEWQVKPGDLWELGNHKLFCGDSTKEETYKLLLGAELIDLCVTSPPYLDQRHYKIGKFNWLDLMKGAFKNIFMNMAEISNVVVILGLSYKDNEVNAYWQPWIDYCKAIGHPLFGWYVWDKGFGMPGVYNGRLASSHEWIFHFRNGSQQANKFIKTQIGEGNISNNRKNGKFFRNPDGSLKGVRNKDTLYQDYKIPDSVIRINKELSRGLHTEAHPAVYPVALPTFIIRTWTDEHDIILEPFAGSGTTFLACENTNRICRGIEISPEYCAVILQRFKDATGKEPVRINE